MNPLVRSNPNNYARLPLSVTPEALHAWEVWQKVNDFADYLWNIYEYDFMALAASEPSPKSHRYPKDDLPF